MKILFVHQGLQTFVQKDLDILQSVHTVNVLYFRGLHDLPKLIRGICWADMTFSWFGKINAFFAVLFSKFFGKKAVVVAGGDDVANELEIKYGMFSYWWKKWVPLFVFKYADLILPVSQFTLRETVENTGTNPSKVELLYHGFDAHKFKPILGINKEQIVITVGGVDWERLERKGYERFVRSAAYLPEVKFALIGKWYDDAIDYLRELASDNVIFAGWVSDEELLRWFGRAKVYVQASVHEGFGCSVAEAMLCECIPVVSYRTALSEVVGDCGFYVDDLTPQSVANKIKEALASDLGQEARARIMQEFPLEKRREALLAAVGKVMNR